MSHAGSRAVYLDCAATTPIDPRVRDEVLRYLESEFGNAGSRPRLWANCARGHAAARGIALPQSLRLPVAMCYFTSGATESDDCDLGSGRRVAQRHFVTSSIEHHAVLEPVAQLHRRSLDVTF